MLIGFGYRLLLLCEHGRDKATTAGGSTEETLQHATNTAATGAQEDPWQNGQDPWRGDRMGCGQPNGPPITYGPTRFTGASNNFVPHMTATMPYVANTNGGCQNGSHAGVDSACFLNGRKRAYTTPGMETLDTTPMFGMMNTPHAMMNGMGRGMRLADFPMHPVPFGPCGPPYYPPGVSFPPMPDWWMSQVYGGKGQGNQGEPKKDKNKKSRRRRQKEEEDRSRDSEDERK